VEEICDADGLGIKTETDEAGGIVTILVEVGLMSVAVLLGDRGTWQELFLFLTTRLTFFARVGARTSTGG